MRVFTPLFILFIFSCEQIELVPVTAETLIEKISIYKGEKAVLVNIWALWCVPCVEEFPMIVKLQKKNNDLKVIFVNVDFEDQFQDVVNFLNDHNVGSISYIKKQKDETFINEMHDDWSGSLPFTLVYAKKSGNIVDYWEGKKEEKKFNKAIGLALGL